MEWISVNDRLPDHNQKVIICNDDRNYVPEMARYFSNDKEHWYGDDMEALSVTHWMPLPEPPKK